MLQLGTPDTDGVCAVLRDGVPVATLRPDGTDATATAEVTGRSWAYLRAGTDLSGRWVSDPQDTVRHRARRVSGWKGTWSVVLDGTEVAVARSAGWRGARRYTCAGRTVAEAATTGGWSPRPTLDVDPALPLDQQVFLLWVELVASGRTGDAGSAAIIGADDGAEGGADGGADGGGGGGD